MSADSTPASTTLDVRRLPCELRRATILETFDTLGPGEALEIVNSFDPIPLRQHFEQRALVAFSWDYVEKGPDVWRIRVTRH